MLELFTSLAATYEYLGIFLVSMISSASVLLPAPSILALIASVKFLDPFLLTIVYGTGAAVGELLSYGIGFGGRNLAFIKKTKARWQKLFDRTEKWFERHGGFVIIVLFSATPLPHDIVGLFCGIIKYDVKKFFIATFIGKFIQTAFVVYAALYSIDFLVGIFA